VCGWEAVGGGGQRVWGGRTSSASTRRNASVRRHAGPPWSSSGRHIVILPLLRSAPRAREPSTCCEFTAPTNTAARPRRLPGLSTCQVSRAVLARSLVASGYTPGGHRHAHTRSCADGRGVAARPTKHTHTQVPTRATNLLSALCSVNNIVGASEFRCKPSHMQGIHAPPQLLPNYDTL
jgi:hypothetical protein